MRFMMIVKASKESEAGILPDPEVFEAMDKYNQELVRAGVLLDAAGLQASSSGWRVRFSGKQRTIVDGPFPETKELIAGFWVIQVRSREEALEWSKRIPMEDAEVEVRPFFEAADCGREAALASA